MNSTEIIEIIGAVAEALVMVGLAYGFKVQKKKTETFHNDTLDIINQKIKEIERKTK